MDIRSYIRFAQFLLKSLPSLQFDPNNIIPREKDTFYLAHVFTNSDVPSPSRSIRSLCIMPSSRLGDGSISKPTKENLNLPQSFELKIASRPCRLDKHTKLCNQVQSSAIKCSHVSCHQPCCLSIILHMSLCSPFASHASVPHRLNTRPILERRSKKPLQHLLESDGCFALSCKSKQRGSQRPW